MAEEKFRVVELEEQLVADQSGELLRTICDELHNERSAVKRQIDAGLAPDEFERAQTVHEGLKRAETVMKELWELEHKN